MPYIDLGRVVGPQGAQGATGPQGPQGVQGPAGPNHITSATATTFSGVLVGNGSTISTKSIDNSPTDNSSNLISSGAVSTALNTKPTIYKDFVVPAGKSLEITTKSSSGNYALLLCVVGARATTTGVFYVSGYSKNPTYHQIKTLAAASDVTVVNSAEKIIVTNGHASDQLRFLILELYVDPVNMLDFAVTT
ncbi:MAG: collagen-like protein [Lachnospiraceae bacterium]|nr:collagen-like protein [Lachnospiraceae bacterium]